MTVFVNNKHVYCVEPRHVGGAIEEVLLEERNFFPLTPTRNRKKARTTSYLVIGFDTEYKSRDSVTPEEIEAGAKNKLLSYQFFVRKVDETLPDGPLIEAEGIIIPEGDERLRLADFIAIAAGSLVKEHPRTC